MQNREWMSPLHLFPLTGRLGRKLQLSLLNSGWFKLLSPEMIFFFFGLACSPAAKLQVFFSSLRVYLFHFFHSFFYNIQYCMLRCSQKCTRSFNTHKHIVFFSTSSWKGQRSLLWLVNCVEFASWWGDFFIRDHVWSCGVKSCGFLIDCKHLSGNCLFHKRLRALSLSRNHSLPRFQLESYLEVTQSTILMNLMLLAINRVR